jgi:hypothetical protein
MSLSSAPDWFNGCGLPHRTIWITKDYTQQHSIVRWRGHSERFDIELIACMLIAYEHAEIPVEQTGVVADYLRTASQLPLRYRRLISVISVV